MERFLHACFSNHAWLTRKFQRRACAKGRQKKHQDKRFADKQRGAAKDSPSIVFAAAVALIGRPPQRRYESSYKAPAQDNETLDHLLSLLKDKASLLANHAPLQAIFFVQKARIFVINFLLRFALRLLLRSLHSCVRGVPKSQTAWQ